MTPEDVRAIVRDEIETYAAAAFEALSPAVAELIDVFGITELPIVGPVFEGLTNLFGTISDDDASAA